MQNSTMSILESAFTKVQNREPNAQFIAQLACELEQTQIRNRNLLRENMNIRDSRRRHKTWTNRLIKYYKAHRDELLNDKQNNICR